LSGVGQSFAVKYQIRVRDAESGAVVRELPKRKNLIMDGGLDAYATNEFCNLFSQAIAGTGTTPTSRASNPITITQAANVIVSNSAFFTSADVGRIIKYGDVGSGAGGAQYYITAFTNSTTVTVSGSATVTTPQYCVIWYVNQTTMAAKVKATSTYALTGNGTVVTISGNTCSLAHTRIFIFSAEAGTITYQEIGWSWNGTNIFGRDLIEPAGVTLIAGQQLEVTLEVTMVASPAQQAAVADVSGGTWNTAGTALIEFFRTQASGTFGSNAFTTVASPAGGTVGGTVLEPNGGGPSLVLISGAWTQLTEMSSGANTNGNSTQAFGTTVGTYVPGAFSNTFTASLSLSQGIGGPYTGIAMGNGNPGGWCWSDQLTTPQSKDSSHTLTITFTISWNRILSN
jgi:hypothetical protein